MQRLSFFFTTLSLKTSDENHNVINIKFHCSLTGLNSETEMTEEIESLNLEKLLI